MLRRVVCGVDWGERVRCVLRRDLPVQHGLIKLLELPPRNLPEHHWRIRVDSVRQLCGGPVCCIGRIGGMHLVRRWFVLWGGCWTLLELRCGHLSAKLELWVLFDMRCGLLLFDKWPLRTVALSGW